MAKNKKVKLLGKQKFRRRRGPFREHGTQSTLDREYLASEKRMKEFWGENVSLKKSKGPNGKVQSARGTDIPEDARGTFTNHAKFRPDHREDNSTPKTLFFLATIFPGAKFVSAERQRVLDALREAHLEDTQPEYHVSLYRTQYTCRLLYFTADKKRWWYVEREHNVLRTSIRYVSKYQAEMMSSRDEIEWSSETVLPPNSS